MKLTSEEIMRYGAETEREKTLIDALDSVQAELNEAKELISMIDDYGCDSCNGFKEDLKEAESEIKRLKTLLDNNGIWYE